MYQLGQRLKLWLLELLLKFLFLDLFLKLSFLMSWFLRFSVSILPFLKLLSFLMLSFLMLVLMSFLNFSFPQPPASPYRDPWHLSKIRRVRIIDMLCTRTPLLALAIPILARRSRVHLPLVLVGLRGHPLALFATRALVVNVMRMGVVIRVINMVWVRVLLLLLGWAVR